MSVTRFIKPIQGAFIGLALAGVWLMADLLLQPKPLGDFQVHSLIAITNMAIGWRFAVLHNKLERASAESRSIDANVESSTRMNMTRLVKIMKSVFAGLALSGGWLAADLILPEPEGDPLLYGLIAVTNIVIGWRFGVLRNKLEQVSSDSRPVGTNIENKFES